MKKAAFIVLFLILLSSLAPVLADGGIIIHDNDMWMMFDEEQQYCAINYHDETQYMILSVDTAEELSGDQAVWIFPVPADPKEVDINIIKGFPELLGKDLEKETQEAITSAFVGMSATQIYPLPFFLLFFGVMSPGAFLARGDSKGIEGVTVYESIEKMGMTTELISAADEQAFNDYLVSNELAMPGDLKSIFDEYIGEDYAFVVSWISDVWEFRDAQATARGNSGYERRTAGNTIGVYISFPTEEIYYPLKPTSVYGQKKVPAVIYVLDYVTPDLYEGIESFTEVDYFILNWFTAPNELKSFFTGYETSPADYSSRFSPDLRKGFQIYDIKYTKIKIDAPSNALTQDLWIKDKVPKKILVYNSLVKRTIWWGILIFILLSCLASMIAGGIVFAKDRPSLLKFLFFGFYNLFTLIGIWVAAYWRDIDHAFTGKKHSVYQSINLTKGRTAAIVIPLVILGLLIIFIPISLLLDLEMLYLPFISSIFFLFLFFPVLVFLPLILWGAYRHKKILVFNFVFSATFLVLLILSRILLGIII